MKAYAAMSKEELKAEYGAVSIAYKALKEKGLKLDMSRGKPCREQLDMVSGILSVLKSEEDCFDGNIDVRNYGEFMGIPACRRLFAEILGVLPEEVFVGGNSSIHLMYDVICHAYTHGLLHSPRPWCREKITKFLCPAPGYDNHFKISEFFGSELITVPMTNEGPDMDMVEEMVKDAAVKGIWCVPKFSNPQGITYSEETVRRLAALKPAAADFTIMWDNAYCVHELEGDFIPFPDMLSLCKAMGNPDMVYEFASTSKMTMPGAGVAVFASSKANMAYMSSLMATELISYNKVNMLRHVRYLQDKAHTVELMKRHAEILKPRFDVVTDTLEKEISPLGIGAFARPKGGYFVSFETIPGLARRTLSLCNEAGVLVSAPGVAFPYGMDPKDSNIRIAPTRPPISELKEAMNAFCVCVKLASLEHLLHA